MHYGVGTTAERSTCALAMRARNPLAYGLNPKNFLKPRLKSQCTADTPPPPGGGYPLLSMLISQKISACGGLFQPVWGTLTMKDPVFDVFRIITFHLCFFK